jgi:hypothetical protein
MRTITPDWASPAREQKGLGSWLSNIGDRLRKVGSRRTAHRQTGKVASDLSCRGSHEPFVQADAAAFVGAFMRLG